MHQKQQFLTHLSKTQQDWQVKQADYALRLYNFFLSKVTRSLPTPGSEQTQGEWLEVEQGMTQALRLRHHSLGTERSCLTWLRQFRAFIQSKSDREIRN